VSADEQRIGPSERCATRRLRRVQRKPCGPAERCRAAPIAPAEARTRPGRGRDYAFGWRSRSCGFPRRSSAGCGSVAFAAPLMPFSVSGAAPGCSDRRMQARFRASIRLLAFTSRSARPTWNGTTRNPCSARTRTSRRRIALSPSDSILQGPLLRLVRGGPLPAHSPRSRHEFATKGNGPSGRGSNATTILFRPRGFAPPRRFTPHRGVRACCVPVPDMGFAAFLDRQATSTEVLAAGGRATPFPKERGTTRILAALTLRRFDPRRQPLRIAAVVASTPFGPPLFTAADGGQRVGGGSDGPPADAASRPFPPGAAPASGRRLPVLSLTRCRGCRTPRAPPGLTQELTTSARRPRTCRVLPHDSRRSTSRPLLHRRVRDVGSRFRGAASRSFHGFLIPLEATPALVGSRGLPRVRSRRPWRGRSHTGTVSVRGGCRSHRWLPTSGGF
jgi:hypothetical protein